MNTENFLKTVFTKLEILKEDDSFVAFINEAHFPPDVQGYGNGYVAIKIKYHPLYNVNYENIEYSAIDIHGGLTFSRKIKDMWVLGFDTAHVDDNIKTWPRDRVEKETLYLLNQIKNYGKNTD